MEAPTTTPCGNSGFAEKQVTQGNEPADKTRITADLQQPKVPIKKFTTTPLPLPEDSSIPPYPIEALGQLLGEAAKAIAYHVQTPVEMAAQSVLAAASLVTQAHIDVARGNIGDGPSSLFCLTIAESGDRKSAVDKLALAPIRHFEQVRIEALANENKKYRAALETIQIRRNSILAQYKKTKGDLSDHDKSALQNDLERLENETPKAPDFPNITFAEPTAAAIWRHYQNGLPFAGLFSDEGVSFFSGHGMRDESKGLTAGDICRLWDGSPLTRTRAEHGESGVLQGRRVAAHLMMQPIVAQQVLSDPLLSNQGFLARFLVCQVDSIAGSRFLANRDASHGIQHEPEYTAYKNRLAELLERQLPIDEQTDALAPNTWRITGDAYTTWVQLHDGIESELRKSGQYSDIKAAAAKAAENSARIAAALAFIEGAQSITPEHIERSGQLIAWYLESMAIHTRKSQYDLEAIQAKELLEWINAHEGKLQADEFNRLPSAFRSAKKARGLLGLLVAMGHLNVVAENTRGKPSGWEVNHA
jgi:hypothetical protein